MDKSAWRSTDRYAELADNVLFIFDPFVARKSLIDVCAETSTAKKYKKSAKNTTLLLLKELIMILIMLILVTILRHGYNPFYNPFFTKSISKKWRGIIFVFQALSWKSAPTKLLKIPILMKNIFSLKKISFVFLAMLPLFIGCVIETVPSYHPHPSIRFRGMAWNSDGSKVFAIVDSIDNNGINNNLIRIYDKNGTLIRSFNAPGDLRYSEIWGTSDDSTIYYRAQGDYSYYYITRYSVQTGASSIIAGGTIYGESQDRSRLFIGPYGTYGNQGINNNFLIVDVRNAKVRLQRSWADQAPSSSTGIWMGNKGVGYFRFNSLNLIDFVIVDTNGLKVDSLDPGITPLYNTKALYSPGKIYLSGSDGIIVYDSVAKNQKTLTQEYVYNGDIAADGTFIIYMSSSSGGLSVINTANGTSKALASGARQYFKISPATNLLAYVDNSNFDFEKLAIIPVTAP